MNIGGISRVAKIVGLLCFFLPWITVSCSGQKIASASGWNLATGKLSLTNPMTGAIEQHSGSPSIIIILALLAVILAMFFSFQAQKKLSIGFSIGAIVLSWLATVSINGSNIAQEAGDRSGGDSFGLAAMIQVDYAFGFWFMVLSLAVAAFLDWRVLQGDDNLSAVSASLASLSDKVGAINGETDTGFWDRMSDKNDPDALQEYLLRFPSGRFSELARQKLNRMNVEPIAAKNESAPPTAAAVRITDTPKE